MARRDYESPDMAAFIGRTIRAMVARAAEGDLEAMSALAQVRRDLDAADKAAADALRRRGYSWTDVGRELGITRQSAQQRLAMPADRCPHGRSQASRVDSPCPRGFAACAVVDDPLPV